MTAPVQPQTGYWGNAQDWSQIITGAGQGANSAMAGASTYANSKKEAKEAKRKTLANLLNAALKRNQGLLRAGQEYSDDMSDYQSQALQNVARGFVSSMQGSTGRM